MRAVSRVRGETRIGSVYAVGKVSDRPKPVNEAPGADTGEDRGVSRGSPWRETPPASNEEMAAAGQPAVLERASHETDRRVHATPPTGHNQDLVCEEVCEQLGAHQGSLHLCTASDPTRADARTAAVGSDDVTHRARGRVGKRGLAIWRSCPSSPETLVSDGTGEVGLVPYSPLRRRKWSRAGASGTGGPLIWTVSWTASPSTTVGAVTQPPPAGCQRSVGAIPLSGPHVIWVIVGHRIARTRLRPRPRHRC